MVRAVPRRSAAGGGGREGGAPRRLPPAEAERVRHLELVRHVKRRSPRGLARHPRA